MKKIFFVLSLILFVFPFGIALILVFIPGIPWIISALFCILGIIYLLLSIFESDKNEHHYITFFGQNAGIVAAGSGIHFIPLFLFETDALVTEQIEQMYPAREELIDFSSDRDGPVDQGKVRTYRITTGKKNMHLSSPLDITNADILAEIEALHIKLEQEEGIYKSDLPDEDPLKGRLTLEPRYLVKYKLLDNGSNNDSDDSSDEEKLANSAELFFRKFTDMEDLRYAIGVTVNDILTNIFGRKTPENLIVFQEFISKIVTLRLDAIYSTKGVQIIHFGLSNPGIPKDISVKLSEQGSALVNKAIAILAAQGTAESTKLTETIRLDVVERSNSIAVDLNKKTVDIEINKKSREAEIAATAKKLILFAEAEGFEKLITTFKLEGKEAIVLKQLETVKEGMRNNNLNVIMSSQSGSGLQDFLDLAKVKLTEQKQSQIIHNV